jgi:hypothetical protein
VEARLLPRTQFRIRTVKPELLKHKTLFQLDRDTGLPCRLTFIGLFMASDREGRFIWNPELLHSELHPYDPGMDFPRVLDALATRGFIRKYEVNGEEFGLVLTFKKHQVVNGREGASELPEPPGISCLTRGPRVADACGTRGARGVTRELEREREVELTAFRTKRTATKGPAQSALEKVIDRDRLFKIHDDSTIGRLPWADIVVDVTKTAVGDFLGKRGFREFAGVKRQQLEPLAMLGTESLKDIAVEKIEFDTRRRLLIAVTVEAVVKSAISLKEAEGGSDEEAAAGRSAAG